MRALLVGVWSVTSAVALRDAAARAATRGPWMGGPPPGQFAPPPGQFAGPGMGRYADPYGASTGFEPKDARARAAARSQFYGGMPGYGGPMGGGMPGYNMRGGRMPPPMQYGPTRGQYNGGGRGRFTFSPDSQIGGGASAIQSPWEYDNAGYDMRGVMGDSYYYDPRGGGGGSGGVRGGGMRQEYSYNGPMATSGWGSKSAADRAAARDGAWMAPPGGMLPGPMGVMGPMGPGAGRSRFQAPVGFDGAPAVQHKDAAARAAEREPNYNGGYGVAATQEERKPPRFIGSNTPPRLGAGGPAGPAAPNLGGSGGGGSAGRGGIVETEAAGEILVQGGTLRTWSFDLPSSRQIEINLSNGGGAIDAEIELWHAPVPTTCPSPACAFTSRTRPSRPPRPLLLPPLPSTFSTHSDD